ncbi:MAG: hypothetical protein ACTSYG_02750, partial [Candidatus Heimdallarchaeota archaeon]
EKAQLRVLKYKKNLGTYHKVSASSCKRKSSITSIEIFVIAPGRNVVLKKVAKEKAQLRVLKSLPKDSLVANNEECVAKEKALIKKCFS